MVVTGLPPTSSATSAQPPRDTGAGSAPSAAPAAAFGPAVSVDLSGVSNLLRPETFEEMVAKRTEVLATRLTNTFEAANIRIEDVMALRVDRYGTIQADGPQKDKIEKLMREDPELAKEFRTVATLNAMQAAAEALRLHAEEMKAARDPKDKRAADDRYAVRSAAIHELSGSMSLKDGRLISAAMVYAESLADPGTDVERVRTLWQDQRTDFLV
jgi:hypothetical protein